MSFSEVLQAITTIGFPIVACIGIAIFFNKINENYRMDIKEINALHHDEMKNMTEAVNNNTLALQKLTDSFQKGGDDRDK